MKDGLGSIRKDIQRQSGGGGQKIIAAVLEQPVIEKIMTHLGLQVRQPQATPITDGLGGTVDALQVAADSKDRIKRNQLPCRGGHGQEEGVFEDPVLQSIAVAVTACYVSTERSAGAA